MSVDYKVRQIYNVVIKEVTETPEAWKSVLRLAGQIYRYEFDNVLMVYAQKPYATLVADFDTWKKVGRYVKRGSKGIAIYPSKALQPYMRYVFDISDTGGKQSELTWNLDGDKLISFMEYQVMHGKYQKYEGVTRGDSLIALKDFTKQEIGVIIGEEFEKRMTQLSQITGSVIKEFSEKREGLQEVPDLAELARKGILYVVGTRCGFDLSAEEQDFSQIVKVTDEDTIYRLGSLICDVSCNVLRAFSKDCRDARNQKSLGFSGAVPTSAKLTNSDGGTGNPPEATILRNEELERRIAYGSRTRVQGSGWTSLSGIGDSGRDGELGETG